MLYCFAVLKRLDKENLTLDKTGGFVSSFMISIFHFVYPGLYCFIEEVQ